MLDKSMLDAEQALIEALKAYESNGIRYEPADREELQNLILQIEKLRQRLHYYMNNLPNLDHHPFGSKVSTNVPRSVQVLFDELDSGKFISPEGPLAHSVPYQQLKDLFTGVTLSIAEAFYLLRKERTN